MLNFDSRVGDLYIEKYIQNTELNENQFEFPSGYLTSRMLEPTQIKHNELIFLF